MYNYTHFRKTINRNFEIVSDVNTYIAPNICFKEKGKVLFDKSKKQLKVQKISKHN